MSFKIYTPVCINPKFGEKIVINPNPVPIIDTYDFVIVGAGQAGCVLANGLSKDGKYSVCLIEAGRDDARLAETLPLPSYANVPQPDDFKWGGYIRTIATVAPLESRGFINEWFFVKQDTDKHSRSLSYPRVFGWGGCTSHNRMISIRNAPFNWNSWNLDQWTYDNVKKYYLKVENRSQINNSGFIYYNKDIPNGQQGSFHSDYGINGKVMLLWNVNTQNSPLLYTSNRNVSYLNKDRYDEYKIPINVDLDNPDIAHNGGTSLINYSMTDQYSSLFYPSTSNRISFEEYNFPLYGDLGYVYPPELEFINLKGKAPTQRSNSSNSYLYPSLDFNKNKNNLRVMSETLVTSLITENNENNGNNGITIKGVNYIKGWNIYQAGRNLSIERGGYGGTPGDAKANYLESKITGQVYARKEVILCAGFINTPQIMMLSGIGDKNILDPLGIPTVLDLYGVGKSLIDNPEIFPFWETSKNFSIVSEPVGFSVKSSPSLQHIDFDIRMNSTSLQSIEAEDNTIQYGFCGTKNLGALDNQFVRNKPSNILIDPVIAGNPYTHTQSTFQPIYSDPSHRLCMLIEQVQDVLSEGYLKITSKDPTIPPKIVGNYLNNEKDMEKWVNLFINFFLPFLLNFKATSHASPFVVSSPLSEEIIIPIEKQGSGHTISPVILVNGLPLSSAEGVIKDGKVISIKTNIGGKGYTETPIVMFYGGGAKKDAKGVCTISGGKVISIDIINGGEDYKSPPKVLFLGNCDIQATATCQMNLGKVESVVLDGTSPFPVTIDFGYYFDHLLDPAPYDILNDGVVEFTDMSQVNINKLKTYLYNRVGAHHGGGTCKMGSVTDQKGLVYGTSGLRICDMSIVPVAIRWPNTTLYVVAEKILSSII